MAISSTFQYGSGTFVQISGPVASIAAPLPGGSGSTSLFTNIGDEIAFIQLGGSAVSASLSGIPLLPKTQIALSGGTAGYFSGITLSGRATALSVVTGT